jgi:hypothetical protein
MGLCGQESPWGPIDELYDSCITNISYTINFIFHENNISVARLPLICDKCVIRSETFWERH